MKIAGNLIFYRIEDSQCPSELIWERDVPGVEIGQDAQVIDRSKAINRGRR
jgi:hypothetical protein